jgi:DNA-binding beta-propeller fold protein YncE
MRSRAGVAAIGLLLVTVGGAGLSRPLQSAELLYVCVQDDAKIAVVDMAARSVVRTIDLTALGFTATAKPHYIVVEPDGSHWYVSLIGANRVLKFDRSDKVVGQYEMETPGMLSLAAPDRLVVTRSMSAVNPPKRLAVINRTSMQGEEVEVLFARPHPNAVAGSFAYTGSLGVNQIASVNLGQDNRVVIVTIQSLTMHSFVQFTVSPDGKTLVGSTDLSGQLLVFDLADPVKPKLTKSIGVGKMAFDPVFTPDGSAVWVPVKSSNEIVIIDRATWKETARIKNEAFREPHQIVFSTDGATAFVTNNNKMDHMADPAHAGHAMPGAGGPASLVVVDVKTRRVDKAIELGRNLTGMGTRQGR